MENRKDFKDLINLKSLLFIARLNSNQFVGTQRVCDVSVRCVYVRTTVCIINLKSLSSQPDLRCQTVCAKILKINRQTVALTVVQDLKIN